MAGVSVGNRLESVRARVASACAQAGRSPDSVRILAVSKGQSIDKIRSAYEHGQRDFGENFAQESAAKMDQLHSLPARWHFIGRIQSNKVKVIAGHYAAVHSVDRMEIARRLNMLSPRFRQDILLEFNSGAEDSKGGLDESGLRELLRFILAECPHLRVMGLMTMPPAGGGAVARSCFQRTRAMLDRLRRELTPEQLGAHPLNELSMGTTADFEEAIAEGATWIRVGSEIFGPREERT